MKKLSAKPFSSPNGKISKIQNTNKPKLTNAKDWYYGAYLELNGQESFYMFTEAELNRAAYRASRNKEDFLEKGWITDILD